MLIIETCFYIFFILDWAAVCFLRWRWIRTSIYFWIIIIINSFNTMLWLINGFNFGSTISIKLANVSCQLCWYQVKNLSFSHVLVYVLLSMPDIFISFIRRLCKNHFHPDDIKIRKNGSKYSPQIHLYTFWNLSEINMSWSLLLVRESISWLAPATPSDRN